jgi:periplasmic protein CpxP/Spy
MRWTIARKTVVGSLGALALATASAYAVAVPEGGGRMGRMHGGRGWGGPQRLWRGLDLTEEQRASLRQILQEHHQAQEPLRQQERELRQQIRQQLDGGSPDPATIGQLTIQAHAVGKQRRESWAGVSQKMEGLLTPEQKAKLEELKSQRGQRERGRIGPGRQKRAAPETEL